MIGGSIFSNILGIQYTIGELMNIDAARQLKSKQCKVKLIKIYHELKKENLLDKFKRVFGLGNSVKVYYLVFKFEVHSDTGNKHIVFVRTSPDFSLQNWSYNKVKIYCDCNDFKFRSAYTLNQRNSLFLTPRILKALGGAENESPKRVSPTLLCKHAFASLNWLMANYQKVMKSI
jgi:hypothetical protein